MNGHVRKRGKQWEVVLELGEQVARRCPTCIDRRGRGRRYWAEDGAPDTCPLCRGELEELAARRQELLPERFTRKQDAEKAMHDAIRDRERGDYVPSSDLTVRQFLENRWLPAVEAEELSPSTVESYKLHVRRIVPHLGGLQLQRLNRNDVARMMASLAKDHSPRKGRPLSAETRRGVLVALHRALHDAVEAGLLRTNPASGVKRPKVRRQEMHTWTHGDLATFLKATA